MAGRDSVASNRIGNRVPIFLRRSMMGLAAEIMPWAIAYSQLHPYTIVKSSKQNESQETIESKSSSQEHVDINELLKPNQAASKLGISVKTLHRLCREGRIGFVKINQKERGFSRDQIHDYIARQTVSPRIDSSRSLQVNSISKGGTKKKPVRDSRADLRKEMHQWQ